MSRLEDLTKGALVKGVFGDRAVKVVYIDWHGSSAVTLTYTDELSGGVAQELLYREDEARLVVQKAGRAWSMDADGILFRLVSEAKRISLAYLFDPFLAVQTSTLRTLPHQIDAVYNRMLPPQPLRFLLADDPGAGKTIMAGLFCKELMIRGDVERCLIIAPGSLVEQWQDELWQKFALDFKILTKDMIEAARSGNPFDEQSLLIARLDHLSRNEDLQAKLAATDWDLIVVDEAHKMAAHYMGGETKETKRYKLGRLAGSLTRHFVLMTATPHAGIEEDFQLFLALLDADRFEGKPRDASHMVDTPDLMRRLVKEKLLDFDGRPLFPERRAYTAVYPLSEDETLLYKRVTDYVVEEMNRADRLKTEGEGSRGAIVGFALTTLQRRLASSPEAIYQSLFRRRRRLEKRLSEEQIRRRGAELAAWRARGDFRGLDDDFDLDDLPEGELEDLEEELVDEASAARTIADLKQEIATLADLEELARQLRDSGADRKWEELSRLLRHTPEMYDMYDLPWNPNRIEQRFGRVHRIGQTEVCHLWNLVAEDTREGQVFGRLFEKLDEQRRALGDQVFDVLGEAFRGMSLRDLLIRAVRYGEQPDVKQRLKAVVDATVGDTLRQVVHDRALVSDVMTAGDVERIREEMERAEARKLQPHFIRSFFLTAFAHLGGVVREREPGRFEINNVPAELRHRDRQIGRGAPLLRRYERVTFEKDLIAAERGPAAEYITPGHPLLDGTIDLIIERYDSLLRQGAVLIDERDPGTVPNVLVYLQHSVVDGRADQAGNRRVVSRRFEFVSVDPEGTGHAAGWAPYLDLRHATAEEISLMAPVIDGGWIRADLENAAFGYGIDLARAHLEEVRRRTVDRIERTTAAVRARLESEIRHWDHRANQLREHELAGKLPRSGMNSANARQRADELQGRLKQRLEALSAQRQLSSQPPVVTGAALVVPAGLLSSLQGATARDVAEQARERSAIERAAVDAVMAIERALGHDPVEMPPNNKGYDIESKAADGSLLFLEVKGRSRGAKTFTVTRSEIGIGRNMPDQHILALAEVSPTGFPDVKYVRGAFQDIGDLPFDAISVNLQWRSYFDRGEVPA